MRFALALGIWGALQIYAGVELLPWGAFAIWSGTAWVIVGAGYAGLGPRVFGKREDGSRSAVRALLLLPYLGIAWGVWWLSRRSITKCGQEIVPGIWLGPWPLAGELAQDVGAVLDMTAEFPKAREVGDRAYLCHPLLDETAPDAAALQRLVAWIESQGRPAYVHCAGGHGRSATVVAAVLLARGLARDVDDAVATIQRSRPRARLNRSQRIAADAFARGS